MAQAFPRSRFYGFDAHAASIEEARRKAAEAGLGAQAGEARLAEVFRTAGFTRFRRAAETPFNLILEARR
jgi:hypothetical protein